MLTDAEIMAQNRNPRWRPSAILDLYIIISDHPQSPFIGPHRPVKFYANPVYSFEDNYDDLNFLQIWLEMPIHAPPIFFDGAKGKAFSNFDPNLISSSDSDPEGRFLPNFVTIG